MRCLASHRVFVWFVLGDAWEDVYLRVVGNHALVHAVERQSLSVGAPERAFADAELVAVYALSVNQFTAAVVGKLVEGPFCIDNHQLVVLDVCRVSRPGTPVVGVIRRYAVLPHHLLRLEVDEYDRLPVAYRHNGLVGIGEGGVHQVAYKYGVVAASPRVDVVKGEQLRFLPRLLVDGGARLHVGVYQFVAPPCRVDVLRSQVGIVVTTEVEVFQGEQFLLSHERCGIE